MHAHYTVFGRGGSKDFPGSVNEAHKVLDKHYVDDNDKVDNEDKLAEIMETYTDTTLQKIMGANYKKTIDHATKEAKLSKKDLRELKGQLLMPYIVDKNGKQINQNITSEQYLKQLKGKKKLEIAKHLLALGEGTKRGYGGHLAGKAIGEILSEEDRVDLAKYITPIFEAKGFKHEKAHIMRSTGEMASHYGGLLRGSDLTESGYKPIKYKPKEKGK